ncbi:NAD(P)H-dependent oxidoreductase [Marivita hallyeonensis]|uniref:Predicted homoserine dehydrogenase, contains C-terminal SAF domain n=1 Tax=Marivita hallyeonensis TaxID=996342 RepID=A0A1M5N2V7_9RHOB|nr:Gfo/Idh/MocA family oxidoreductase [Marivita hallyeonensis]SHG83871.1 Predicted homoserine dehydrogenase, contains C-terminal SAF domain [Marivita hallyeonensis]
MNLFAKLQERAAMGNPIRVGMIGAGKFGTMFLSQALRLKGIHIVGVVDLNPGTAKSNMKLVGWEGEAYSAASLNAGAASGATFVGDDWQALIAHPAVEIIIECTGNTIAAVTHALTAFQNGKHVINVTVEADAFVGPGLADRAREAGVIYSMAYGDQPALASDLVDWARACGFSVVAAGRGHKWMPHYRQSTPDTVWDHWGLTREQAERGRLNPKIFNALLDGSKPAIESAAIANVCGLDAPADGLVFPSGGIDDVPNLARARAEGGVLDHKGMVDFISCLTPDGAQIPHDIRKGVWVCFEGDTEYLRNCFEEYKVVTDDRGRYRCNYKRWHLIGLELGISVASVGLRGEPTGAAQDFRADVAAVTKRNLKKGEILDGEGGYSVAGGLRPASLSLEGGYVPLGLAHNVTLIRDVPEGQPITWNDIKADTNTDAYRLRREVETRFSKTAAA